MIKAPLGCRVLFVCDTYAYAGEVANVSIDQIDLKNAEIVLDTGPMNTAYWNEAEYLGNWSISVKKIESWGKCEKTIKPNETNKPAKQG